MLIHRLPVLLALICAMTLPTSVTAQSITYSQQVEADTFVSSGQPDSNFGSLGAMEIAGPTGAQSRTEDALLRFNTAAMQSAFDSDFGAGNWTVTGVTLTLFSNVASAGQQPSNPAFNRISPGNFEFDLLNNNGWSETSITWNTLSSVLPGAGNTNTLTALGTFFWDATGSPGSTWTLDTDSTLLSEIYNGGKVSIFGQPAAGSTVGYLFNTLTSNPGILNVTAVPVPEPDVKAILCILSCWYFRFYRGRYLLALPACRYEICISHPSRIAWRRFSTRNLSRMRSTCL